MKTDTLFYRLFQDRPALVFELAGLPLSPDAHYSLRAEILMILDLTDTDLRNTRYFQDVFAEGQLEGRNEGREEGRRGEAIGFVLRLLRRLGPPAEDTQQRIAALTVPQIEALGEVLLDFTQPADLTDWFRQHG